jgi:predicted O-methyltransferase YrrM
MGQSASPQSVQKEVLNTYSRLDLTRFDYPQRDEWVLWEETMKLLGRLVEVVQPRRVIEFGSGLSTVVLAGLVGPYGGRVLSFEHKARFARRTVDALRERRLDQVASVAHQRLTLRRYGAKILPTYAIHWSDSEAFQECEVALIDGPPGWIGREATLYELFPRLAIGGWVVVDDMNRSRDRRWLHAWKRVFANALDVQVFPAIGEGVALLRKLGSQPE